MSKLIPGLLFTIVFVSLVVYIAMHVQGCNAAYAVAHPAPHINVDFPKVINVEMTNASKRRKR